MRPVDFHSLGLHPRILKGLKYLGYNKPTPVQVEAIPPAVQGKDVIARSETGSGKTAAFMLPIAHRLLSDQLRKERSPRALVLLPTRELAIQSLEIFHKLERGLRLRAIALYGGVSTVNQAKEIKKGVDLVASTPGRLIDLLERKLIDLGKIEVVVLDEVDRMLDMGFLPDVRRILSYLPEGRQNLVFSATLPKPARDLIDPIMHEPVHVRIGEHKSMPIELKHAAYSTASDRKPELVARLLSDPEVRKALIFVSTRRDAEKLYHTLGRNGVACDRLHSDRSQSQRLNALEMFSKRRIPVLIATDVAARGLDIRSVSHVIHYDVQVEAESYLHRAGRTARAESAGISWSLVAPEEEKKFAAMEHALKLRIDRIKITGFDVALQAKRPFKSRRDPFTRSDKSGPRKSPRRYPWQ